MDVAWRRAARLLASSLRCVTVARMGALREGRTRASSTRTSTSSQVKRRGFAVALDTARTRPRGCRSSSHSAAVACDVPSSRAMWPVPSGARSRRRARPRSSCSAVAVRFMTCPLRVNWWNDPTVMRSPLGNGGCSGGAPRLHPGSAGAAQPRTKDRPGRLPHRRCGPQGGLLFSAVRKSRGGRQGRPKLDMGGVVFPLHCPSGDDRSRTAECVPTWSRGPERPAGAAASPRQREVGDQSGAVDDGGTVGPQLWAWALRTDRVGPAGPAAGGAVTHGPGTTGARVGALRAWSVAFARRRERGLLGAPVACPRSMRS